MFYIFLAEIFSSFAKTMFGIAAKLVAIAPVFKKLFLFIVNVFGQNLPLKFVGIVSQKIKFIF
ncbi:hypothetical protein O6B34_08915 [Campylobacter ureolyticus]|nr:hypothetical protein [Campylobacter ureolyticus]MCZ6106168.1 hypothetical protein [Campylobacter ureolyticus]